MHQLGTRYIFISCTTCCARCFLLMTSRQPHHPCTIAPFFHSLRGGEGDACVGGGWRWCAWVGLCMRVFVCLCVSAHARVRMRVCVRTHVIARFVFFCCSDQACITLRHSSTV